MIRVVAAKGDERGARTVGKNHETWLANARANGARGGLLDLSLLWNDEEGLEALSVAAGPSLKADFGLLEKMRPERELCVVDAAAKFVVDAGLIPDYILTTDASDKVLAMFDGLPPLPDTRLVANVIASPRVIDNWRGGDIHWFVMANQYYSRREQRMLQDCHALAAKIGTKLVPGGNVSSVSFSFLAGVRNSKKIHLFGHDFCWTRPDEFYAGGALQDMAKERIDEETKAGTVKEVDGRGGRRVLTNQSLERFARWHEQAALKTPGRVANHSSSTILHLG